MFRICLVNAFLCWFFFQLIGNTKNLKRWPRIFSTLYDNFVDVWQLPIRISDSTLWRHLASSKLYAVTELVRVQHRTSAELNASVLLMNVCKKLRSSTLLRTVLWFWSRVDWSTRTLLAILGFSLVSVVSNWDVPSCTASTGKDAAYVQQAAGWWDLLFIFVTVFLHFLMSDSPRHKSRSEWYAVLVSWIKRMV